MRYSWLSSSVKGTTEIDRMKVIIARTLVIVVMVAADAATQQLTDREYMPPPIKPSFARGEGPLLLVDEGHNNAMLTGDRLTAFVKLVTADGYVVKATKETLTNTALLPARILMVSNAGPGSGRSSAFSDAEIATIERWVRDGGALLLVADHMPRATAVEKLAAAFGVRFSNAFTLERHILDLDNDAALEATYDHTTTFRRADGTLREHAITDGGNHEERIDHVTTFTGQGFPADTLDPLLVFPAGFISIFPKEPWDFRPDDRRIDAKGLIQGGVKRHGSGRAAFFGEAAMFTAQTWGAKRTPMGLNHPRANQNAQFVLNLLRWLSAQ